MKKGILECQSSSGGHCKVRADGLCPCSHREPVQILGLCSWLSSSRRTYPGATSQESCPGYLGLQGNHRSRRLTVLGTSCCQGAGSRQQLSWAQCVALLTEGRAGSPVPTRTNEGVSSHQPPREAGCHAELCLCKAGGSRTSVGMKTTLASSSGTVWKQ